MYNCILLLTLELLYFQLESFQPFFVSLNLPSYVTRGEQFVLEAVVFNYLEEDTEVNSRNGLVPCADLQLKTITSCIQASCVFFLFIHVNIL